MGELRVVIAGSREFNDYHILKESVWNAFHRFLYAYDRVEVVSGCATGADQLGEKFAKEYGFDLKRFPANWKQNGKMAGCMRNEAMAQYAVEADYSVLIAFPIKGRSAGTWDMINKARSNRFNEIHIFMQNEPVNK